MEFFHIYIYIPYIHPQHRLLGMQKYQETRHENEITIIFLHVHHIYVDVVVRSVCRICRLFSKHDGFYDEHCFSITLGGDIFLIPVK